jgi:hypothetical protein
MIILFQLTDILSEVFRFSSQIAIDRFSATKPVCLYGGFNQFAILRKNNITNFMELSPPREAANCVVLKNYSGFYGIRRFITVFTIALHWSLS